MWFKLNFFKVASVTDAQNTIKSLLTKSRKTEKISLRNSLGRILAEDLHSTEDVPNFNKSTVDGYAVVAKDTYGASDSLPTILNKLGGIEMGEKPCFDIVPGQCAYIPTGGMLPEGTTGVVMVEYSEELGDETFLHTSVSHGENIIYRGEDIRNGDVLLSRGTRMTPQNIGALAAAGVMDLPVYSRTSFSIISTGDEIMDTSRDIETAQVRDVNSYTIGASIESFGGSVDTIAIIGDDLILLKEEIKENLKTSDVVILSGGSSVGTKDFTLRAVEELGGEIMIHGISMKPGKPTIVGRIGEKLVVGLPGHPVSATMVFRALFEESMTEKIEVPYNFPLGKDVHSTPGRTTYQTVTIEGGRAIPSYGKSGVISLLSKAFGYIIIPSHKEGHRANEVVEVYKL